MRPGRLHGNDIDGIIDVASDYRILIEITVQHTLAKVREDLTKLTNAKNAEMAQGTTANATSSLPASQPQPCLRVARRHI